MSGRGRRAIVVLLSAASFSGSLDLHVAIGQQVQPHDFLFSEERSQWPLQDTLDDQLTKALATILSPSGSSIVLSSLANPRTGRLIQAPKEETGVVSWCAATAISANFAITAAHCTCNYDGFLQPANRAECDLQVIGRRTSFAVYFPAYGVRKVNIEEAIVHPDYFYPNIGAFAAGNQATSDLALIPLSPPLPVTTMPLGRTENDTVLVQSFGSFGTSSSDLWKLFGLQPATRYSAGLGHFNIINDLHLHPPGVRQGAASDVYSQEFQSSFSVMGGQTIDDGIPCKGDSGSPLISIDNEGKASLAGIASYIEPPEDTCSAELRRISHYVDIRKHSEWLTNYIGEAEISANEANLLCGEHIVSLEEGRDYNLTYRNLEGIVTVQTISSGSDAVTGQGRPSAEIAEPGFRCTTLERAGLVSCLLSEPSDLTIGVSGKGLLQFTICKGRNFDG